MSFNLGIFLNRFSIILVMGINPRTLCMLNMCSTTEILSPDLGIFNYELNHRLTDTPLCTQMPHHPDVQR